MEIINYSLEEIREEIISGEITAESVVKAYIDRIKDEEEARVEAFISLDEEGALRKAREIDEKVKNGEELGSLCAAPIAIKDNISTKGLRTTCGSKMLEDYIPPFNASIIDLINQEDGIIIGKTNLDEFAVGSSTEGSYYGVTNNPVDKNLVPGGSSGGSAAALKSRQSILAVGTDTGGSVRQPAAFCDVVGIKPTYGSISRYGVVSMASSLDQVGIFANNTRELGVLLKALMKFDEKDSTSCQGADMILKDFDFNGDYSFKGMKIAYPVEFKEAIENKEMAVRFDKIVENLKEQGARVEEISMKHICYSPACYHAIATAEVSSSMARFDGIRYGYRTENYSDLNDLYIKSRSESLGNEIKRRIVVGNLVLSEKHREDYYLRALKIRRILQNEFKQVFGDFDLIISPTSPTLPFEIGKSSDDTVLQYKSDMFTVPANLVGIPAISLPGGFIDGRPFGIQFMADSYREDLLIKAGMSFEGGNIDEL